MKYVDRSQDVKPGDSIVTSGMDGIFPRGLLVGTIASVYREGPGLFLSVKIRPAVDFRKLEQVLILTQQPPQLATRPRAEARAPDILFARSRCSDWRLRPRSRIWLPFAIADAEPGPDTGSGSGPEASWRLPGASLAFAMGYATDAFSGSHLGLNAFMMTMSSW